MRRCNYQWVGRHDLLCLFFFYRSLHGYAIIFQLLIYGLIIEKRKVYRYSLTRRGKPINFQTIAERQNRFATFLQDRNCTSVLLTSNFCFWNLFFEFYSYFSLSFFLLFAKIINHEARKGISVFLSRSSYVQRKRNCTKFTKFIRFARILNSRAFVNIVQINIGQLRLMGHDTSLMKPVHA